jgi:pyruvate dehydrogenase E1 component alpha subunit
VQLTHPELLEAYRRMRMIRAFELTLEQLVQSGRMGGFLHLSTGQEAVAVGVCRQLRDTDFVASTHRGHGHCLAKGVDLTSMMAELFGRATGCSRGRGGSMHMADPDHGLLGTNGIVGAGIPLATGAALSAKLRRTGAVAVSFMGDGATNQGSFHESLNMAAIWKLPVVYVVENNGWSEFTPTEFALPIADIAVRAGSYAMASAIADGMDFFDVAEKAAEAVARARAGDGPTLLECKTYRFPGHSLGDSLAYRAKGEAEHWAQTRDPLQRFEQRTTAAGLVSAAELRAIDAAVDAELAAAVATAEAAPLPDPAELMRDVYAGGVA